MKAASSHPLPLKIVLVLFITNGMAALAQLGIDLLVRRSCCNLTYLASAIFGLYIGQGLWAFSFFWLVCSWLYLGVRLAIDGIQIVAVLAGVIPILAQPALGIFGLVEIPLSREVMSALIGLVILLNLWQLWVLTRPEIGKLFKQKRPQPSGPSIQT